MEQSKDDDNEGSSVDFINGLQDMRLLLVGKTGHGKSSTANSILGLERGHDDSFVEKTSSKSVTLDVMRKKGIRFGRKIEVVDCPGFCDTFLTKEEIKECLNKMIALTLPGFSAIGFVLKPDRFTKELIDTVEAFNEFFGNNVQQYAFIILTHTNCEKSKDEYLQDSHEYLDKLRYLCAGNVVYIDNKCDDSIKEKLVGRIIEEIHRITETNENTHFSNKIIKEATKLAICSEKEDFEELKMSDIERQRALESFKTKVDNREANIWNKFTAGMRRNTHYIAGVGAMTTFIAMKVACSIM